MMRLPLTLLLLFILIPAALAGESPLTAAEEGENRIIFGLSQYNPLGAQSFDHRYGFRMELRLGDVHIWKLHPWLGVESLPMQAGYIGGGLETDIDLNENWVMTLQTGAGYLDDGVEHYTNQIYPPAGFEFRSQIELAYKLEGGGRLGVGFAHISDAGLRKPNPGVETLSLNAHIPLTQLSKPAKALAR